MNTFFSCPFYLYKQASNLHHDRTLLVKEHFTVCTHFTLLNKHERGYNIDIYVRTVNEDVV